MYGHGMGVRALVVFTAVAFVVVIVELPPSAVMLLRR